MGEIIIYGRGGRDDEEKGEIIYGAFLKRQ